MAIPSAMRRTIHPTHSRSMILIITTTCLLCLVVRRTITSRWVLDPIPPARSTPINNGPKARMDSTDTNGLPPPSPPRQVMSAQGCTLLIIQTNTRGLPSHHHITLILLIRAIHDQSRHTTTTHKRVEKGTEAMVVLQAMFRPQDLASDEARLGTSTEPVEGAPENHPSVFRSALAVR